MGVYGSTLGFSKITGSTYNTFSSNYEIDTYSVYNGIDWVCTHVETLYMYDYKIVYFWLLNNIYDESTDFFFISV